MDSNPSLPQLVKPPQATHDLTQRLKGIHGLIRSRYDFVDRVAVALYDPSTDLLKTFVSSNTDNILLKRYEVTLASVPSLSALVADRQNRIVGTGLVDPATLTPHELNWRTHPPSQVDALGVVEAAVVQRHPRRGAPHVLLRVVSWLQVQHWRTGAQSTRTCPCGHV